ncbi:hypothetical protein [Anoxybacillus gonensis]|nr:hypothetical protein [Anoxybacillus gonensis]EMI11392.1 hypothetical protein F510_0569 [Anoxybacillus gonensis]
MMAVNIEQKSLVIPTTQEIKKQELIIILAELIRQYALQKESK